MRVSAIVLVLCAAGLVLLSAFPQEPAPNLSGTWKVNKAKTTWGPARHYLEWRIKQERNKIELVTITEGQPPNKLELVVDGKPRVVGVVPGSKTEVVTRASWEGRDLVLNTEYSDPQLPRVTSRISLSANGKVLTIKRSDSQGDSMYVFERQ